MAVTKLTAFEFSSLPSEGIYRLSEWSEPLDPPPPPESLGAVEPAHDSSGRWDAPYREFSTLYCATQDEGCFGEKLGAFLPQPDAVLEIEEFLVGDPDDDREDEEDLTAGLDREDVEEIGWKLAWAPTDSDARAFDLGSTRTWLALLPSVAGILSAFGVPLTRAALRSSRRSVTRRIAGKLYEAARDEDGDLGALGLRYESWRPPAWECWALWEPLPLLVEEATVVDVTIDHPALRSAAAKLGVPIYP